MLTFHDHHWLIVLRHYILLLFFVIVTIIIIIIDFTIINIIIIIIIIIVTPEYYFTKYFEIIYDYFYNRGINISAREAHFRNPWSQARNCLAQYRHYDPHQHTLQRETKHVLTARLVYR